MASLTVARETDLDFHVALESRGNQAGIKFVAPCK